MLRTVCVGYIVGRRKTSSTTVEEVSRQLYSALEARYYSVHSILHTKLK